MTIINPITAPIAAIVIVWLAIEIIRLTPKFKNHQK